MMTTSSLASRNLIYVDGKENKRFRINRWSLMTAHETFGRCQIHRLGTQLPTSKRWLVPEIDVRHLTILDVCYSSGSRKLIIRMKSLYSSTRCTIKNITSVKTYRIQKVSRNVNACLRITPSSLPRPLR